MFQHLSPRLLAPQPNTAWLKDQGILRDFKQN